jgi:hypothetical protein
MSNFIYIKAEEGQMLINLDQVVIIDEATGDSCQRLGFSDGTRLVLHGPGAADLASRIAQDATSATGKGGR